nr:hypothetical protein [Tanacetum cinerariifolium]
MEQDFGSGCSSGCESGWTIYLGQSKYLCDSVYNTKTVVEDDDDDMSMVSDASSGPPHVQQEEEQECNTDGFGGCKRQEVVKESRKINDLPCFLDDTASSPFVSLSQVGNNQDAVEEEGDNSISDYSKDHLQDDMKGGGVECITAISYIRTKCKDQGRGICFVYF